MKQRALGIIGIILSLSVLIIFINFMINTDTADKLGFDFLAQFVSPFIIVPFIFMIESIISIIKKKDNKTTKKGTIMGIICLVLILVLIILLKFYIFTYKEPLLPGPLDGAGILLFPYLIWLANLFLIVPILILFIGLFSKKPN